MKIGIDISQLVYEGTGVGQYTRRLVEELVRINTENEYVLFGANLRKKQMLDSFYETLPKNKTSKKFYSFPASLNEVFWNRWHKMRIEKLIGPIDIFHSSDWVEPPTKAKKVTTIHDLVVYRYPEYLPSKIVATQKRKLEWVKKESDAIIADSDSTKDDIIKYLDISPEKIHVVHLGVGNEFAPQSQDKIETVKRKYRIVKNFVLCVGTREPRKNLKRSIGAFQKLQLSDMQLVIVGNPGWGDEIQISKNIKVVEQIPISELATLYSGCVCFIYPSLYEGFGLPVLEAMACGTLVVTSNRGSLKEITGDHAIVVDPESIESISEGIKTALEFPVEKRKSKLESSKRHSKSFTWEKTAKKTLEVYTSLAN